MTVYLGDKAVGVNTIVEKEVAQTKFGLTFDNFLGNVDADGKLSKTADIEEVDLSGVKSIGTHSMDYIFAGKNIKRFIANDVESVETFGFTHCFDSSKIEQASFDSIEEINSGNVFASCFNSCYYLTYLSFKKLKRIISNFVFQSTLSSTLALTLTYDEIFPSLEEIAGNSTFNTGRSYKENEVITFSKVKKITGGNGQYYSTFGSFYVQNTVWNFPSVTEITGYIWSVDAPYTGEIHFAAANQAAIEACDGYANKWGFTEATIYFDL